MNKLTNVLLPRLLEQATQQQIERFVVAAVVSKDQGNKILCLKRASHDFMAGLYELPSGRVESNEDLLSALSREVKEETNLDVTEVTDYISYFDYRSGSGKNTRQFNFIVNCAQTNNLMLDDKEHEGYTWCSAFELNQYNISNETKRVIRAFFLRQGLKVSPTQQLIEGWESGVEQFVAGAVVTKDNKALILKRASDDFMGGIYELPSGKLEGGESVEMGVIRELKEETNFDATGIEATLPYFDYQSSSGKLTRQLNYRIKPNELQVLKLSQEHEGFAWITCDEINNYPISREVQNILRSELPKKSLTSPKLSTASTLTLFNSKRERPSEPEIETSHKKAHTQGDIK